MKGAWALLLILLAGCSAGPVKQAPLRLSFSVDADALQPWDMVTNVEKRVIVCWKCHQEDVTPWWAHGKNGVECLLWTCNHCHAQYCSLVAETSLKTVP